MGHGGGGDDGWNSLMCCWIGDGDVGSCLILGDYYYYS